MFTVQMNSKSLPTPTPFFSSKVTMKSYRCSYYTHCSISASFGDLLIELH